MQHNERDDEFTQKANNIKNALSFLREEARKCGLYNTDNSLYIAEIIINIEMGK
ncbi:hypothetical protein JCM25156A_29030 [Komagataeibacter kakiaceti JCM 25156]|nr:hypothetical protein MSKU3_3276 [Komagataeibacter oboediens]GCE91948.1 hypothetical protein MSKU15_3549 [Komagataeibacter diospyri]